MIPEPRNSDGCPTIAKIMSNYAYFGTWSVDPSASTVTHHILQSLNPAGSPFTETDPMALAPGKDGAVQSLPSG